MTRHKTLANTQIDSLLHMINFVTVGGDNDAVIQSGVVAGHRSKGGARFFNRLLWQTNFATILRLSVVLVWSHDAAPLHQKRAM